MRHLKIILFFPILILSHTVHSAQQEQLFFTEEDIMGELPTVSAASRMTQSISRAPASISIIDKEVIDASGAVNWVDVFRLVPGFQTYFINGNR